MSVNRGVILMNLGSPDSTEVKAVRRYLNTFLMDERVIDVAYLKRLLLVKGIIAPLRAPKSAAAYRTVWTEEGSPLIALTRQVQKALQNKMEEPVAIGMRYGSPSMEAAFEEIIQKTDQLEEVVLVPLYPQYAMSSYETAVEHAKEVYRKRQYSFKIRFIEPFYQDPDYLAAFTSSIQPYLAQDYDHILFSFHGIPERHIRKSDPTGAHCLKVENCCETDSPARKTCYRSQCFTTVRLAAAALGLPTSKYGISFQSRLGRDPWLKPFTDFRLKEMPGEGIKKLLVVCPAFVSDCLETLEEIAMQGSETFMEAGGESFTLIPCMNAHPLWIQALEKWVTTRQD